MEFVYVQVNETQECVHDSLNTTTVVVLEVLFPYEIIYMKWVHQCEKNRLKNFSPMPRPSLRPSGGRGVTIQLEDMFIFLAFRLNIALDILFIFHF